MNLNKKAQEIMDRYNIDRVYANKRGAFFTEEYLALNALEVGEKLQVFEKNKEDSLKNKNSAKELIEAINKAQNKEEVEAIIIKEESGEKRATVLQAGEIRVKEIEEMEAPSDAEGSKPNNNE